MLVMNKVIVVDLNRKEHILTIDGDIEPIGLLFPEIVDSLGIEMDIDLLEIEKSKDERYIIKKRIYSMPNRSLNIDIAISFAGEDREIAENIASRIKAKNYSIFYDKYEKSTLWGKDLYTYLSTIYQDKASFCIILISNAYSKKLWTKHELKSAQARAFKENREYILPIRLDNTELEGILPTTGFLDFTDTSYEEIVTLVEEKLLALKDSVG